MGGGRCGGQRPQDPPRYGAVGPAVCQLDGVGPGEADGLGVWQLQPLLSDDGQSGRSPSMACGRRGAGLYAYGQPRGPAAGEVSRAAKRRGCAAGPLPLYPQGQGRPRLREGAGGAGDLP